MMIYKSLFLFVFANLFNQTYNLEQISCPKWVPNTNEVLPVGVSLSMDLELANRVRCYCEVVKAKEQECIDQNVPRTICIARTKDWVDKNLSLKQNFQLVNGNVVVPLPNRDRMINVTP
jgi:hypothetical protein